MKVFELKLHSLVAAPHQLEPTRLVARVWFRIQRRRDETGFGFRTRNATTALCTRQCEIASNGRSTACLGKKVTNLILNNFNKLEPISIIFLHIALAGFLLQIMIIFSTGPPANLLYLAISHSGVNDVSPLRHLFDRASSTKPMISSIPGCVYMCQG